MKHDSDKPRLDLLDPTYLIGTAKVLNFGADKYDERNWEKGIRWGRVYRAALSHLLAWWLSEDNDEESGLHHLYHASCCLMFLAHYAQGGYEEYDDRPNQERDRPLEVVRTDPQNPSPTT